MSAQYILSTLVLKPWNFFSDINITYLGFQGCILTVDYAKHVNSWDSLGLTYCNTVPCFNLKFISLFLHFGFNRLQAIYVALYNLICRSGSGKKGYFRWKEDICGFIEKHWATLLPRK